MFRQMQLSKSSSKKIYQFILSAKQPSELLGQAVKFLSSKALESSEHFDFLLHRISWFTYPFDHYQPFFLKILRIYRSKSKQSSKVIYNLIIQSFMNPSTSQLAVQSLIQIFQESYDKKTIVQCLKQNYPHKLCNIQTHRLFLGSMIKLCQKFMLYRIDFLEIIIENLNNFDTELIIGDQWAHRPFPQDQKIIALRGINNNELSLKFDQLLSMLLTYFGELRNDDKLMSQILVVFQNKILTIKTTKLTPLLVFSIVQQNKNRANTFVSFLLSNIFDNNHKQNYYRIFTQSNFYLISYILRSKRLSKNTISKTLNILIERLSEKLQSKQDIEINERTQLQEIYNKNQMLLIILQTIIIIGINTENISLNEDHLKMIEKCKQKLRFEYFLVQDILQEMNFNKKGHNKSISVKYSNKFLPATLPLIGQMIDPKMKIYQRQSSQRSFSNIREYQPICRKILKGQRPVSYSSETLV